MASTRVLVKRRKAIRNIRKITRTMELIATARFKKAMDRTIEADAYTRKIAELAADLSANAGDIKHPLLEKRAEVKNSILLILCSNRGLCGGYNGSILRAKRVRICVRSRAPAFRYTWNSPASAPSPTSAIKGCLPSKPTPISRTSRPLSRPTNWRRGTPGRLHRRQDRPH